MRHDGENYITSRGSGNEDILAGERKELGRWHRRGWLHITIEERITWNTQAGLEYLYSRILPSSRFDFTPQSARDP